MAFTSDLYVKTDSLLHKLDPRTKILLVVALSAALFIFENTLLLAALFVLSIVIVLLSKIPRYQALFPARMMLPIVIMVTAMYPFFYPEGEPVILQFWIIKVTLPGFLQGINTGIRLMGMSYLSFLLLFTTKQSHLVRGFVKLGVPYMLGLTAAIGLRYIPTFYGLFSRIREAHMARGLEMEKVGFLQKVRSFVPVLTSLMIVALKMAITLGYALDARGFGARVKRTYFRDVRMTRTDYVVIAITAFLLTLSLVARYYWGLGSTLTASLTQ